ncbi:MAG: SUMF1/EgtB/PvdO family nonheme iron enzyme, partial [Polyangiaceae bacterium]
MPRSAFMRMKHAPIVRIAITLAFVGCSDPRVVLGRNATDAAALESTDGPSDARPDGDGGGSETSDGSDAGTIDAGEADAETGAAPNAPSCSAGGPGLTNCGPGESCCASLDVPAGTFYRSYKNTGGVLTGEADPATITGFRLDKYLVTVGRFRQFVVAWNGGGGWVPPTGSGKHVHLNGGKGLSATAGGYETGWLASDDPSIAPTNANLACTGALVSNLAPGSTYATWTPSAGAQENLPITCETWYEAYAFCIWDGGFLPSEAELGYAAAGGSAQLQYPWGNTDPGTDSEYAIYGCWFKNDSGICTGVGSLAPVGAASLGAAMWGHFDLAGTVWEWTLDSYAPYVTPCMDCA